MVYLGGARNGKLLSEAEFERRLRFFYMGGAVTWWLVRSTPDRTGFKPWPGTLRCLLGLDT